MAKTNFVPVPEPDSVSEKTARKPPFRPTDAQRKVLKMALDNQARAISEAPEHPMVDKAEVLADINVLIGAYCVKKPAAPRKKKNA